LLGLTVSRSTDAVWMKLVSGEGVLELGGILLINPALLNIALVSFIILVLALGVSLLVAMVIKRL